jgi:hypothetical protein
MGLGYPILSHMKLHCNFVFFIKKIISTKLICFNDMIFLIKEKNKKNDSCNIKLTNKNKNTNKICIKIPNLKGIKYNFNKSGSSMGLGCLSNQCPCIPLDLT